MNLSDIRFSVVIPNFNNGKTIARAVNSILNQTFPAHEIIVIDDGSNDNSKEVIAQFGDTVRYVYQSNAGVSAARNHGARLATGNWLAFLDADDCFLPARLKAHADWIKREPDLDFLLGDQEFRRPAGEFLRTSLASCVAGRSLTTRYSCREIPLFTADFEELIADGFGEVRTLSLPTERFLRLGGFPEGVRIGEDLHFVIRLCAASSRGGVVNEPLAIYYIYSASAIRKNIWKAQEEFVVTLESLEKELTTAIRCVKRGYVEKLRRARLDLAYSYLRENRKLDAIKSILHGIRFGSGLMAVRDILSIIRGLPINKNS